MSDYQVIWRAPGPYVVLYVRGYVLHVEGLLLRGQKEALYERKCSYLQLYIMPVRVCGGKKRSPLAGAPGGGVA